MGIHYYDGLKNQLLKNYSLYYNLVGYEKKDKINFSFLALHLND